ncbi:MAG: LysR substrate-binding domain-containing protein, partial [Chloroflexota bacterium]|nr:LysR substrate-binding domain-containing protein [Chloroflexota bacterium]
TSAALVSRVHAGDLEAAFVAEPFPARDLEAQHVFNERLVLITPPSVRSARSARDIERMTVVAFASGCSYRRRLEEWFASADCVPTLVIETASYHALVACVAAGMGVAFVPQSTLRTLRADGAIKVHALPSRIARTRTQLVWRKGHRSLTLDALRRTVPRPPSAARLQAGTDVT